MHIHWLKRACVPTLLALASASLVTGTASASDFYQGKTISIIVGSSPGGGYDLVSRVLAAHFAKHIPGVPTVVVRNMPGAGGLVAASYMYSAAPKDGTEIAILQRNLTIEPLFTSQRYDGTKFGWLGSISSDVSVCVSSTSSQVETLGDMQAKTLNFAVQAAGSDSYAFAAIMKNVFGAKLKLISGYPGTSDMLLALQRGEVDGLCGLSYSSFKTLFNTPEQRRSVHILNQASLARDPDLSTVPSLLELALNAEDKGTISLLIGTQRIARPFLAPPNLPPERLDILRRAFDETIHDPSFQEDLLRQGQDVSPTSGADTQAIIAGLYGSPLSVIARAAQALK